MEYEEEIRIGDEEIAVISDQADMRTESKKFALKNSQTSREKLAAVLKREGIGPDEWKTLKQR